MSEYTYLTGRKDLFDGAPPEAMVVLESDDGQVYYAVSHNRGAQYWYEHGAPGRPVGLIALFTKTRVVASRIRANGLPPAEPKRDPIPKSRLDRMQQAQNSLKKAVSQPAPVKPKPEPVCSQVLRDQGKPCPRTCAVHGLGPCQPKPEYVKAEPVDWAKLTDVVDKAIKHETKAPAPKADGFVSIFVLGKSARQGGTFINIHRNGNISLSTKLPIVPGDVVDVQFNPASGLIRVGKVKSGGKALPKSRILTSKVLVQALKMPEAEKSTRIYLTEVGGWWQGQAELVGVAK